VTLTFPKGAVVRIEAEFSDQAGLTIDPTTVRARYKPPTGAEVALDYGVDAALVRDDVGLYHVDLDANEAGTWTYRWEGAGVAQAVAEARFKIDASVFA
jgi:hypothetical protein